MSKSESVITGAGGDLRIVLAHWKTMPKKKLKSGIEVFWMMMLDFILMPFCPEDSAPVCQLDAFDLPNLTQFDASVLIEIAKNARVSDFC